MKDNIAERYSDVDLIQKILAGEKALFEMIIRRNNPFLYKTGRAWGYNHQDTQDLMQETFLNAYLHLSQFEFRASLKTWMIKIMLYQCQRKQKKFSHTHEMAMAIDDQSVPFYSNPQQHDTGKEVLNRELNQIIEKAILKVPPDYRTVFSLREISGLSVAETAEVMQISEANVKVRLNRAKIMLRKEMEQTYSAEEIFDFNLVYCDAMVERVMHEIEKLD